jgi:hypothetical protein
MPCHAPKKGRVAWKLFRRKSKEKLDILRRIE